MDDIDAAADRDNDDLLGIVKVRRARKVSSPGRTKDDNWSERKDSKVSNWLGITDTASNDRIDESDLLSRSVMDQDTNCYYCNMIITKKLHRYV